MKAAAFTTHIVCLALLCLAAPPASAQSDCSPVNPNATPEARALLRSICSLSGRFIVSGQHNFPNHLSRYSDELSRKVGKYPRIWGSDFGFSSGSDKNSIEGRSALINEAIRQYKAGSIITLMWHAVRPIDDEPSGWETSVRASLNDRQWAELIDLSSALNHRWMAQVDVIAAHLARLQTAGIPVLWRPYHEANGAWFWWGGRAGPNGAAELYRMMYRRLVEHHHLNNLVWVWNASAYNAYAPFFPGRQYADVLAADIYGPFEQRFHDDLVTLAEGKPIALGEIGSPPTLAVLKAQPAWVWFMGWPDFFDTRIGEHHKALFASPQTINLNDPLPR